MKYLFLMYAAETAGPQTEEEMESAAPAWYAALNEFQAAGVLVDNNGLGPVTTATTVRVRDGKSLVTDGPFAETHEQLGGYFVLNCKDLDEAIHYAAKIPTAEYGSIEIRPLYMQD